MLCTIQAYGQVIGSIGHPDAKKGSERRTYPCGDAGQLDVASSQPNDTYFICWQDTLLITISGEDLSLDPDGSTDPGVHLALYDNPPGNAFCGPDLATVLNDPSLNQQSPIVINGVPRDIDPAEALWTLRAPDANYNDVVIRNNGAIQRAFNGGEPVAFYLAPITVDDHLDDDGDSMNYENGAACVAVTTDDAIRVIWLNETRLDVLEYPNDGAFDAQRIRISGGLPEWDGSLYSINVVNQADASITGVLSDRVSVPDGEEMIITVPTDGTYDVVIIDNLGCMTIVPLTYITPTDVTIAIECSEGERGDQICIDLTVANFTDLVSMQYTIAFDPTVVRFDSTDNYNLINLSSESFNINNSQGTMTVVWTAPGGTASVPDGEAIYSICFTLIGSPGDVSLIRFVGDPTDIELGNETGQAIPILNLIDCQTVITCSEELLRTSVCAGPAGSNDGSITVEACCGTNPYVIDWTFADDPAINGSETIAGECDEVVLENLVPGTYNLILTDARGIQAFETVVIDAAPPLMIDIAGRDPFCAGDSSGIVSVTSIVSGGSPDLMDYTLTWFEEDSLLGYGPMIDDLPEGTYTVIVTDSSGCSASESVSISQDSLMIASLFVTDASCSGASDGNILIIAQGGTPIPGNRYAYRFDGEATQTSTQGFLTNLEEGTYPIEIRDDNNCELKDTIVVAAAKRLSVDVAITPISCAGEADGCILATGVTIGSTEQLPYSFTWGASAPPSTDTDRTSEICGLGRAVYRLTVTDAAGGGCFFDTTILVNEPSPVNAFVNIIVPESCNPGGDGRIIVATSGGTPIDMMNPPYAYDWGPLGTNNIQSNLTGDTTYSVTVTDANGCVDSLDVYLPIEAAVDIIDTTIINLDCPTDNNGSITIVTDPAQEANIISVTWSNGDSGKVISNLEAGIYTVTIENTADCPTIEVYEITAASIFRITDTLYQQPTCAGEENGRISLIIEGGIPPLSFTWDHPNGTDNPVLSSIPGGMYTVTITDNSDCPPLIATLTLDQPDPIILDFVNVEPTSCFDGNCDGRADIEISGGPDSMAGYGITWENGSIADSALLLCGGFQTITVTNTALCGIIDSILIPSPDPIQIDSAELIAPTCFGDTDGMIEITARGGNGMYTIEWIDEGVMGPVLGDVPAGEYFVLITDPLGCSGMDSVTLTQPDSLSIVIDSTASNSLGCAGGDNGRITTRTTGGTAPYTYVWTGIANNQSSANMLGEGIYTIEVTDANGCTDITTYEVTAPVPIIAQLSVPEEPECFGFLTAFSVISASGGIGNPYTFTINNGPRRDLSDTIEVLAGEYQISVFDNSGCSFDTTLVINQPPQIEADIQDSFLVDLGLDLELLVDINHVLPIDSVQWNLRDSFMCLNANCDQVLYMPISDERFTVRIIDANGCEISVSSYIEVDDSRDVYIPNVFSPNGDLLNDLFRVYTKNDVKSIDFLRIYDRWGNKVHETANLTPEENNTDTFGWNGIHKGQLSPVGVYVYACQITFIDDRKIVYRGDVTLVR